MVAWINVSKLVVSIGLITLALLTGIFLLFVTIVSVLMSWNTGYSIFSIGFLQLVMITIVWISLPVTLLCTGCYLLSDKFRIWFLEKKQIAMSFVGIWLSVYITYLVLS